MKALNGLLGLILLSSCAGRAIQAPREGASADNGAMQRSTLLVRRLAWLEGGLQTDYESDRRVAGEALGKWEGKVPGPDDVDGRLDYLSTLSASGRHAEAASGLQGLLGTRPDEKRAVFLLAANALRAKRHELAKFLLGRLEKDAGFPWKSLVYNNLGMLALQEGNRQGALGYLEKAAKAEPRNAAPLVNLGALYLQSRAFGDAEALFSEAVQLDSGFEDAALGLGASLEGVGKFEDAHRVYSEHMAGNPEALSVAFNDSILLGNRLQRREDAAQQMLRYIQRGGKESARAHEIIQSWR